MLIQSKQFVTHIELISF